MRIPTNCNKNYWSTGQNGDIYESSTGANLKGKCARNVKIYFGQHDQTKREVRPSKIRIAGFYCATLHLMPIPKPIEIIGW
jgi:hypothetical protein